MSPDSIGQIVLALEVSVAGFGIGCALGELLRRSLASRNRPGALPGIERPRRAPRRSETSPVAREGAS